MAKTIIGILSIHGMGKHKPDFFDNFHALLEDVLKDDYDHVITQEIYFQKLLTPLQTEVYDSISAGARLRWKWLRNFALHYLSDAVSYEHRADEKDSIYEQISDVVLEAARDLKKKIDQVAGDQEATVKIVLFAQSLGCHVISNYIYDAQNGSGYWEKRSGTDFEKLLEIDVLFTTGCNIAIFVGGMPNIQPFAPLKNGEFRWYNYFDRDDVLGYPLKKLKRGSSRPYAKLVTKDIPVRAGFGPYTSHMNYWKKRRIVSKMCGLI